MRGRLILLIVVGAVSATAVVAAIGTGMTPRTAPTSVGASSVEQAAARLPGVALDEETTIERFLGYEDAPVPAPATPTTPFVPRFGGGGTGGSGGSTSGSDSTGGSTPDPVPAPADPTTPPPAPETSPTPSPSPSDEEDDDGQVVPPDGGVTVPPPVDVPESGLLPEDPSSPSAEYDTPAS